MTRVAFIKNKRNFRGMKTIDPLAKLAYLAYFDTIEPPIQ